MQPNKQDLYKRIKIAGMLSFIPIILAAGVLSGYFIGEFLEKKISSAPFILPACIGVTTLASIIEVVRIIKVAISIDKGSNG